MQLKNNQSRSNLIQMIESQRQFFELELDKESVGTPLEIKSGYDYTVGYIRGANQLIELIKQVDSSGQIVAPEFVHHWINECRDILKQSLLYSIHSKSNFTFRLQSYLFDESLTPNVRNQRTSDLLRLWYFKGVGSKDQLKQPVEPISKQELLDKIDHILNNYRGFSLNMNAEQQGYYAPFYSFRPYIKQLIEPSIQKVPTAISDWFDYLKQIESNPVETIYYNDNIVTDFHQQVSLALFNSTDPVEHNIKEQAIYYAVRGWLYGYNSIK